MEFDPYVPIQPKQGVTSTFSPYGAGALPGIPQPTENWGKILGSFSESLQRAFAAQEPERREEQEAEAARIVLEQESEELSKMLHEAAKKGEIPAGYSPYMVKQLNRQLARKAAREVEEWSTKNENWFNDPDYRAQDADGNMLSAEESTPTAVLERYKNQYLGEKYPGLMGTAEGVQIFQPLYDEAKRKYVEKTNDLLTKAQLKKLGAGFSDDMTELFQRFMADPDAPDAGKRMGHFVKALFQEMRQSYSGLGYSLPDGSLNEAAIKPMIKALETDLDGAFDQEDVGVVEEAIAVLRQINPKGKNEKESWGFMFKAELDELDTKAARRKQALKDKGLTLGDEDNKKGAYLADRVRGAIANQIDIWAQRTAADDKPTAAEIDEWTRSFIADNYEDVTPAMMDVAMGRLQGQIRDAINDAQLSRVNPVASEVAAWNNKVNAARLIDDPIEKRNALEELLVSVPEGTDNGKAVSALLDLERNEASITSAAGVLERKAKAQEGLFDGFEARLKDEALARARELSGNAEMTYLDLMRDPRFQGLEKFVNDVITKESNSITSASLTLARDLFNSGEPDAAERETVPFLNSIKSRLDATETTYPERIQAFEIGGKAPALKAQTLGRPGAMSESLLDAADTSFFGRDFDEEGTSKALANALTQGRDYYKTLSNDSAFADLKKNHRNLQSDAGGNWANIGFATDASSSHRGVGVDENGKPMAGMFLSPTTNDINQAEADARWQTWSLVEAMNNFDSPRQISRARGSADVIVDARTGQQIPEGFLNWEMFPVLSGRMWSDATHPPTEESDANADFLRTYERTFYPDGLDGKKRGSEELSDSEWSEWTEALEAWEASPSGQVYQTLPDRMQLGEHKFLTNQIRLWQEWAK